LVNVQFSQSIEKLISNKYFYPFVLAIGCSVTFFSLLEPVLNAYKRGNLLVSTVYIIFFIFVLVLGYLLRPHNPPPPPPEKGIFQGVGLSGRENAWLRPDETKNLFIEIEKTINKPIILVGSSGVGKSVLLEKLVVPLLEKEGWKVKSFSNYNPFETFKADLVKTLFTIVPNFSHEQLSDDGTIHGIDSSIRLLFIFDQFEQFLSTNSDASGRSKEAREWFRNFLKSSVNLNNVRLVIVVRKEWYYDLRFLGMFVPPPIKSLHLSGLKMNKNGKDIDFIASDIQKVCHNSNVAETVLKNLTRKDEIIPVEMQIIGLMLENIAKKRGEINSEFFLKELSGKDGLIQRYFDAYLESSPNRDISLKVLFALSVETALRSQYTLQQIADVIHESKVDVNECLKFLTEQKLVLQRIDKYELAHDYLAQKFHDYSGAELDPVQRDNIIFFWYEIRNLKTQLDITRPERDSRKKLVFSDYFMIFISILMLARLTGPIYSVNWEWFNPLSKYQIQKIGIDIYYFPIFISHLAWFIYIALFYRRFLSYIKESKIRSLFSKFTVVNGAALVLASAFFPHFWFFLIGLGGFPVGWKLLQLSRTPDLAMDLYVIFCRNTGRNTMINVSIVMVLGLTFIYYVHNSSLSYNLVERFNILNILATILMVYYMITVTPIHITRNATSKMMGLIDRGKVRFQRLQSELSK